MGATSELRVSLNSCQLSATLSREPDLSKLIGKSTHRSARKRKKSSSPIAGLGTA